MRIRLVVIPIISICCLTSNSALAESAVEQSWRSREALPEEEKINIAPYCPGGFVTIPLQQVPEQKTRFRFDSAQSVSQTQTDFNGSVHIVGEQLNTTSDHARYINAEKTATLTGDVSVLLPEALLSGESATVRPNDDYAIMGNAQFVFADRDIHGTAGELEKQSKSLLVARDMEFTRCAPQTSQWSLSSSQLTVDNDQQVASAWHSTLNIKGVPVMYVPYVSFPLNDQPKTGFLTPTLGSGVTIPYYIHLAPNYDDTIALNHTNDLGYIGQNEFRFLTEEHSGSNAISYQFTGVDNDEIRRWSVNHQQSGTLAGVGYNVNTAWVSDTNADIAFNPGSSDEIDYQKASLKLTKKLGAFNNSLAFSYTQPVVDSLEEFNSLTTTLITSRGNTSLTVLTKIQDEYQNGDRPEESIATLGDYDYLPQPKVTLTHSKTPWPFGITGTEQLQYGHFDRKLTDERINELSDSNSYRQTIADRYHAHTYLSRPFKGDSWSITPTWKGYASQYQLQNGYTDFNWDKFYGGSDEVTQLTWRTNIDAKKTFTFPVDSDNKYLVKPRLFYAYVPLFEDQTAPIVEGDFVDSFALFTDSRFSGIDRTGDMSRLSGSLGYEWQYNNQSIFSITASKGIKLRQERLYETSKADNIHEVDDAWEYEYSDWIGNSSIQFTDALSFTGSVSYSHDWKTANEYSAVMKYQPGDGRVFTLSGIKDDTKEKNSEGDEIDGYNREIVAGAYLPIYKNVALMSYANFSDFTPDADIDAPEDFELKDITLQQMLFGLDFDACCWNLRLAMLRTNQDAFDTTPNSLFPVNTKQTYYFEFTLKGLGGGIGSIENILNRLDFGYSGKIFNYQ